MDIRFGITKTYGAACAVAILIVWAVMMFYPCEILCAQLATLVGIGCVMFALMRRFVPQSTGADYVFLTAWSLLGIGFALNTWWFTTAQGATLDKPILFNVDANFVWNHLQNLKEHGTSNLGVESFGYASLLHLLSFGGIKWVSTLIHFNIACTLGSIILTGAAAARIAGNNDAELSRRMSFLAMAAMAVNCYLMASGALIIKDASCTFMMALLLYSITHLRDGGKQIAAVVTVFAIMIATSYIRPHLLFFEIALLGIWAVLVSDNRHRYVIGTLILVAIALHYISQRFGYASLIFSEDSSIAFMTTDGPEKRLEVYSAISNKYGDLGTLEKSIRMPFSLAVQYFIPLPWAFMRHAVFGPSLIWAHVAYPWYIEGGIFLYFCFFCLRRTSRQLLSVGAFAVLAWLVTAYTTGGTVSRYCLPWLPAIACCVAWTIASGQMKRSSFKRWSIAFGALVIIALVAIYIVINHYTPGGWVAQ